VKIANEGTIENSYAKRKNPEQADVTDSTLETITIKGGAKEERGCGWGRKTQRIGRKTGTSWRRGVRPRKKRE